MPASITTSLKLDVKLKKRVQHLAAARRRSPHWLMREAVEQYVSREEKREQLRRDALAAWNHYQATGSPRFCGGSRCLAGKTRSGQARRGP